MAFQQTIGFCTDKKRDTDALIFGYVPSYSVTILCGYTTLCSTDESMVLTLPDFTVFPLREGAGSSSGSNSSSEVTKSSTCALLI